MDCNPIHADVVELDINCMSSREIVVGLDAYCMFPNRRESRHTGSIPNDVMDVVAALYIYFK